MNNQEKINHIIEDLRDKQETFLKRMQDGDQSRRGMESDLKQIIKLTNILSELSK